MSQHYHGVEAFHCQLNGRNVEQMEIYWLIDEANDDDYTQFQHIDIEKGFVMNRAWSLLK